MQGSFKKCLEQERNLFKLLKKSNFFSYVDAHYFGYMDEEDGQVLPLESEAEKKARAEALDNFKMDKELEMMKKGAPIDDDWDKDIYSQEPDSKKNDQNLNEKDEKVQVVESASGEKTIRAAHVPVPTQVILGFIKISSCYLPG